LKMLFACSEGAGFTSGLYTYVMDIATLNVGPKIRVNRCLPCERRQIGASLDRPSPRSYPLLLGQSRIARTIAQTMPQPIHVMFG
jgi:hypothetical protein